MVVRALSAVEGVEPLELEPLYDSVDPESLDRLIGDSAGESGSGGVIVEFSASGYRVFVRSDGSLTLHELGNE